MNYKQLKADLRYKKENYIMEHYSKDDLIGAYNKACTTFYENLPTWMSRLKKIRDKKIEQSRIKEGI